MSGTYTLVYYVSCACGLIDEKEFLDELSRSEFIQAHYEEYPEDEEIIHVIETWEVGA